MVTVSEFKTKAKRLYLVGSCIFVLVGGLGSGLVSHLLCLPGGLVERIRQFLLPRIHPDWIGVVGTLPLIPIMVAPILAAVAILALIDRRMGIPCPHCGKSLTLRCRHDEVLKTRRCGLCGNTALAEDPASPDPATLS